MNKQSRTPDYNLKTLNKTTSEKCRVGAAWANEDGSISIVLNSFVVLPASKELEIRLFPYDGKKD